MNTIRTIRHMIAIPFVVLLILLGLTMLGLFILTKKIAGE